MAVYIQSSDLYKVFSDLDSFDLKQDLLEQDFVLASGIVWNLNDAGNVITMFRDGEDLGSAEANAGAVTDDSQWFYDSTADKLTLATTNDPDTYRLEFSTQDWETAKTEAMQRASEEFESLMDVKHPRPLPKAQNSNSSRDYDQIIIKIVSILAVVDLIIGSNPRSPLIKAFNEMLYNAETENGYIDRLNKGQIKFSWEITESDRQGEIEEITTDSSTTGRPTDPVGTTTVTYGRLLITIGTGGTLATGTENSTITYSVTDSQGATAVGSTLITGLYQSIGSGISARFTTGIYTDGDQWSLELKGTPSISRWKSISFTR